MPLADSERQELKDLAKKLRLTMIDVMAWSGGAHIG